MRHLFLILFFGFLSVVLPASAGERSWYAAFEGGANWGDISSNASAAPLCGGLGLTPCAPDQSVDGGWAVFGAIGQHVSDELRIEVEVGHRTVDLGGYDFGSTTAIANVIYDVPVSEAITVSLGAGVGGVWLAGENTGVGSLADNDTNFAYQAMGSVSYDLSSGVALTATYRYLSTSGNLFARVKDVGGHSDWDVSVGDVDESSVSLGLRFAL